MRALTLWWMRWRWARRIRTELGLSEAPSLQEVVDAVAARRGRPVRLLVEPLEPRLSGYCAQSDTTDYIVVDANAGPVLQYQVVCHELVHLHRGHRPADHDVLDDETAHALFSTVSPEIVRMVLGRGAYDADAEIEAEVIGTVLLQCLDLSRTPVTALSASFQGGGTGV
ncbi:hypothetical protein [Streptomyces clavuligerus]|nr:hypothetical protein [Streptomyces clavuligerus]AXU15758.1 hypothetical protein D1794_25420 [Streptomyces clavuligerus]MBY6305878.1 hypothetical protein [Streptomyces clavuligerus]QCS08538.1 hypothetical protein CRV15_24790 [Streptomyces clavuligerus]QPJ92128.1 hypothetical protein GE265_03350 [Streptomyces clavuligerus]QPL65750.1 hypothetical protein I3J04_24775 [Streptomyces clavuligerus]